MAHSSVSVHVYACMHCQLNWQLGQRRTCICAATMLVSIFSSVAAAGLRPEPGTRNIFALLLGVADTSQLGSASFLLPPAPTEVCCTVHRSSSRLPDHGWLIGLSSTEDVNQLLLMPPVLSRACELLPR